MSSSHLAIQISEDSARFVSLKNGLVLKDTEIHWEVSDVAERKSAIDKHFDSTSFLNEEFDDVSLAWSTKRSTLVPNTIFAESSPSSIFELCYGKEHNGDDIDYNRISELSIINVFEIPDWIKRYFVLKFPRIIIQHEGTHVLRQVMNQSTFRTKVTAVLHPSYFQLTIVRHNELEFYSYFDYQSSEDVLYYIMYTLQQKELTNENGSIELAIGAGVQDSILSELESSLGKVKDLDQLDVKRPGNFISKSQLLCV